jgi:hypothetical protein
MEPLVVVKAEPVAEAVEARREDRQEDRRGERRERPEPRNDSRGERDTRASNDNRPDRREPRDERREPRDYRRDRDLGPAVVGMGDHVPDFILRSFALTAAPTEEVEEAATGTEG